jgi:hypothetical protein
VAVIRPMLVRLVPSYADKLIAQRRPARTRCCLPGHRLPAGVPAIPPKRLDLVRCDVINRVAGRIKTTPSGVM